MSEDGQPGKTTMEATGVSEDGQPVQAAMEVGPGKVDDQPGKTNAGTEESVARTGKTKWERLV